MNIIKKLINFYKYNRNQEEVLDFTVNDGDRICQMAIREAPKVDLIVVDELSDTVRGDAGFGSTGI